jgi:hypothetical protein
VRHQLAQVSYGFYGLFPDKLEIPEDALYKKEMLQVSSDSFMLEFLRSFQENTVVPKKIKIWGTNYEPGMLLVVKKELFGELTVGLLKVIAVTGSKVTFGFETFLANQANHNYYVSVKKINSMEMVDAQDLCDHHPLLRDGTSSNFSFSLHHFISCQLPE